MDAVSSQLSVIFGTGDTTDPLRDAGACLPVVVSWSILTSFKFHS